MLVSPKSVTILKLKIARLSILKGHFSAFFSAYVVTDIQPSSVSPHRFGWFSICLDRYNFFILGSSPVSSLRKPSHPIMDFFSSNLLGNSSSPGSNSSHAGVHEMLMGDFLVSEENLQKVENVLDLWSSGLKVLWLNQYNNFVLNSSFSLN